MRASASFLLLAAAVLACSSVALARLTASSPETKCGTTLDGIPFDFSSLTGTDLAGAAEPVPMVWNYSLNVCGVLNSAANAPCTQIMNDASACQQIARQGTGALVIGAWEQANQQWSWIDPNNKDAGVQVNRNTHTHTGRGRYPHEARAPLAVVVSRLVAHLCCFVRACCLVQYTMTGSDACWVSGPPVQNFTVNVQFVCGATPSPPTFDVVVPGDCTTNYTIATPQACIKGSDLKQDGRTALF